MNGVLGHFYALSRLNWAGSCYGLSLMGGRMVMLQRRSV